MNPKVYVGVTVEFDVEGKIRPTGLTWEDGRKFSIDKILDCRRAASQKAGGQGIRYTCVVRGKEVYLFHEETRWFMERRSSKS